MPKLIDYPRTNYTGAWELSEVVDDTGGKCTIETTARKMNRKVSGSFKAIIGSAVKFGLITSKRELLTTTTLFKRIKHAYDKQEELLFHKEAFLTPPLFTQICRKFRDRELPIQMLDVMLIREFGVEEINAQAVAKAFVEGCRMCGILDENNIITDIDIYSTTRNPRREQGTLIQVPTTNINDRINKVPTKQEPIVDSQFALQAQTGTSSPLELPILVPPAKRGYDAIATLFGFEERNPLPKNEQQTGNIVAETLEKEPAPTELNKPTRPIVEIKNGSPTLEQANVNALTYQLQVTGPGINTSLEISDEADVAIAIALLEKIRRQFRS